MPMDYKMQVPNDETFIVILLLGFLYLLKQGTCVQNVSPKTRFRSNDSKVKIQYNVFKFITQYKLIQKITSMIKLCNKKASLGRIFT